jgi:tetratricopeptide (TPR) repeat protein
VPGKKAWTWGHGSYGTMHQKDLTDSDGPYNEVQTGPLLTQGEVGRLDPCEAVEWQEWWYPIHGLGGFTFANKDVAVNASRAGTNLVLRALGTANWKDVEVSVWLPGVHDRPHADAHFDVSARSTAVLKLGLREDITKEGSFLIELRHRGETLALFPLPLNLPKREPPARKAEARTATELAEAGWQDFLFARFPGAESHFRKALEADPKSELARIGLAFLHFDDNPKAAAEEAARALETAPNSGLAHFARAVAADRLHDGDLALDEAWKAALDPATAVAGRALVAKLESSLGRYRRVIDALSQPGPWQTDPLCHNRLAFACLQLRDRDRAVRLARENLVVDPLDAFARSILCEAKGDHWATVAALMDDLYPKPTSARDPVAGSWAGLDPGGRPLPSAGVFPHWPAEEPGWRDALKRDPKDGHAALYLGHLLFHLGRYNEGREMWKKAAELGAEPVIAYRALGMAAKTLDNDLKTARAWLEKANQADPKDSIVARDLANVLFALADQADTDAAKRELVVEARDRLKGAFAEGRGRSDYAALLARSYNRLGDFAETARMLDSVRVTIWEGAHEAHDLFEEAHLALGDAQLAAGHPAEALAEFNRALTYPENLATGRLETTCDAHIQYRRGQALAALGRKDEARAAWQLAVDAPPSSDPAREEARRQARAALQP